MLLLKVEHVRGDDRQLLLLQFLWDDILKDVDMSFGKGSKLLLAGGGGDGREAKEFLLNEVLLGTADVQLLHQLPHFTSFFNV
jgi:hypothetical protein